MPVLFSNLLQNCILGALILFKINELAQTEQGGVIVTFMLYFKV